MGRSQRHLREYHGVDSAGDTHHPGAATPAGWAEEPARAEIEKAAGTQTDPAIFAVAGRFNDVHTVTANLKADGGADQPFAYNVPGDNTDPAVVAEGLRALIDADADFSATRDGYQVKVLAVNPIEAVSISSVAVT